MSDKSSGMSVRQAAELDYALVRNGWTPEDIKWLTAGTRLATFLRVCQGDAKIVPIQHILKRRAFNLDDCFLPGWSIAELISQRHGTMLDTRKIELKTYRQEGESRSASADRLRRIRKSSDVQLDGEDLTALMSEKGQRTLWRMQERTSVSKIAFFGVILKSPSGDLYVPCLSCVQDGAMWLIEFELLDGGALGYCPSACLVQN